MATKSKLIKELRRLEKAVGQLARVAPSAFFDHAALNPIDTERLEVLLLSLGFSQNDPLRIRHRWRYMREQEKRVLFNRTLRYKTLYEKWINEIQDRSVALGFPKRPRSQLLVKLERAVNKLVLKIREGLNGQVETQ